MIVAFAVVFMVFAAGLGIGFLRASRESRSWARGPFELPPLAARERSSNHAAMAGPAPSDTMTELGEVHLGRLSKSASAPTILVVEDDEPVRDLLTEALGEEGFHVIGADDGLEGLERVREAQPDLIISDIQMPRLDGLGLVSALRADPATQAIPLIFLSTHQGLDNVVRALDHGADDYLVKPFELAELIARIRVKLARRPIPTDELATDLRTGLLSEGALRAEVDREVARSAHGGASCTLACVSNAELDVLHDRLGGRAEAELAGQLAFILRGAAGRFDLLGRDRAGRFMVLLPDSDAASTARRLDALSEAVATARLLAVGTPVRLTPTVGYAVADRRSGISGEELWRRAVLAAEQAAIHLDLQPVGYEPRMDVVASESGATRLRGLLDRGRLPFQIALAQVVGLVLPFLLYVWSESLGIGLAGVVYPVVVAALLMTALLIWVEGFAALRRRDPPERISVAPAPASAIIAAYLPNEAATILETVRAFLALDHPPGFQVILAYNTPSDMAIEGTLREVARRDPRFLPYRVHGSTSKAQNVNAAMSLVTGEFVGIFDADHQPHPDAFSRAWGWLSAGYDVIQGHCVVRNGDASAMARTVAVEFESIYAVSHPGRARMHGFGIFGGSNGYWRTDVLRRTRMRGSMLTEDIDSSLRVAEAGGRIANDPHLVSRELAPTTVQAVWGQRMRWAQGWFQVSLRHMMSALRSPKLTLRNKAGLVYLLGWRELYPWVSVQVFPLIAFYATQAGGLSNLEWDRPIFVLAAAFTLGTGPVQTLFAYLLAEPEIRRRRKWFLWYLVVASLFYTEFKNLIARVAQVRELMGERPWKVTPRELELELELDETNATPRDVDEPSITRRERDQMAADVAAPWGRPE